ncbi:MAG: caspase family protein [Prevotella sp.]|nr:caspase family protein [Candidatus Prevotella equi]
MKKIISSFLFLASVFTANAQDTYQVLSINSEWPVNVNGTALNVGDTFTSDDQVQWTDKKQSMDIKQVSSGSEYRISRRQFAAKGRDVKSLKDLYSYTSAEVAYDRLGKQKINLVLKETNKAEYYPEKRFALVIGNSFYSANPEQQRGLPSLAEAQRKTEMLTDSLNNLGYDVLECYDLNTMELKTVLSRFVAFSEEYQVALFYYAGHMLKSGDDMLLVPVNVRPNDGMLAEHCTSVAEVMNTISRMPCESLTAVFDAKDMTTGTPVSLPLIDGVVTIDEGKTANIKVAYSIDEDFLGSRSENLYAKKKAEEAQQKDDMMAAINALAAAEEATVLTTPEDFYNEAMRLLDKSMPDYSIDNAMTYFKKAANKGHVESMYQLALLYDGKDAVQSMIWMGRASSAGHAKAKAYVAARKTKPTGK